jgi:toxin ParE1/3/4
MTPVELSPRAKLDLFDITIHLSNAAGIVVAEMYSARFKSHLARLAEFPAIGTPRSRLGKNVRMLVEHPYLLLYSFDGAAVRVLRVLHGRRRMTRKLVQGVDD